MVNRIAEFDGSIVVDRTKGEVAARCDAEAANVLCERLLFDVPEGGTQDLDESMIRGAVAQQAAGKLKDAVGGRGEEATDRRTGGSAPTPPS